MRGTFSNERPYRDSNANGGGRRCSPAVSQSQENTRFPRRFSDDRVYGVRYIYNKRSRATPACSIMRAAVDFRSDRASMAVFASAPMPAWPQWHCDPSTSTGNGGDSVQIVLRGQFIQPGAPRAVLRLMNPNLAFYRVDQLLRVEPHTVLENDLNVLDVPDIFRDIAFDDQDVRLLSGGQRTDALRFL